MNTCWVCKYRLFIYIWDLRLCRDLNYTGRVPWSHLIFCSFLHLKPVPIYFSCWGECGVTVAWRSPENENTNFIQLSRERVDKDGILNFMWTNPLTKQLFFLPWILVHDILPCVCLLIRLLILQQPPSWVIFFY